MGTLLGATDCRDIFDVTGRNGGGPFKDVRLSFLKFRREGPAAGEVGDSSTIGRGRLLAGGDCWLGANGSVVENNPSGDMGPGCGCGETLSEDGKGRAS